jgi:hypothetical protein
MTFAHRALLRQVCPFSVAILKAKLRRPLTQFYGRPQRGLAQSFRRVRWNTTETKLQSNPEPEIQVLPSTDTLVIHDVSPLAAEIKEVHGELTNNAILSDANMKTHEFDTYKLVLALQVAGFSQGQAVALMKCLRAVLINGTQRAKVHYLSRGDLENVSLVRQNLMVGDLSLPSGDG